MGRRWRWALLLLVLPIPLYALGADLQGSAGISSDNVFRGLSLSRGEPSLFGDLHDAGQRWVGGLTVQTVHLTPYDSTQVETVAYLGYLETLDANWSGQLGVRHYDYPWALYRSRYDYDELSAEVSLHDRLSLTLIGSPDAYQFSAMHHFGRGAAFAAELAGQLPLPYGWAAQLGLGYQDLHSQVGAGYAYWSAGIMWRWHALGLSASYIGTDGTAQRLFGSRAGNRAVASAIWFF